MFSTVMEMLGIIFAFLGATQVVTYVLPILYVWCCPVPNLKLKYNTDWALITGGSSGIGKALAFELAKQNLNLVIVALNDALLTSSIDELSQAFPHLTFRPVGVDLSPQQPYLTTIDEATSDLDLKIIFNNAGYIATGFFADSTLSRQLGNLECNLVAAVKLTHHFMERMSKSNSNQPDSCRNGCIVFTSSASAYMPSPFACMYGGTKAFLSQFAACLAVEANASKIDVLAVHPSPVSSRFYDQTHKLDALDFAKWFAVAPEALPQEILKSIGRVPWRDIGGFALVSRCLMNCASYNFWVMLFATFAHHMPDFKRHNRPKVN